MSWTSFNGLIQKLQASQDDARIVEISTESSPSRAIKSDFEDDQKRWLIVGICLHSVIAPALRTYIPPFLNTLYSKLKQSNQIHQQTYPNQLKCYRPTKKELNYEAINNNDAIPKVRGKRDEPKYDYNVMNNVDLSKLFLQTHMAHYNAFDDTCDSSALLGILIGLDVFPSLVKPSAEKVRKDIRNAWAHCNFTEWDVHKYQTTFQMMNQFIRSLVLPLQDEVAILGKLTHWETNGIQFLHGTTLGLELVTELKIETGAIARYLRDVVMHTDDSMKNLHTAVLDIDNSLGQLKNDMLKLYGTSAQLTSDIKTVKENVEGLNLTTDIIIQKQEIQGATIQNMKESLQEVETKVSVSEACSTIELELLRNDLKNTKTNVDKNRAEIEAISKYVSHSRSSDKIFFYTPNRLGYFIGRDDEIDELMQNFIDKSNEHALQVICGLGGTGKTSIAIEFAWRYQNFYPGGVFWMSAESNDVLEDSFQRLSIDVNTVGSNAKETMYKTLKWLSSIQARWLLVIDNVDMEEIRGSIKELILGPWKRHSNGHILITSRRESSLAIEEFNTCATDCLTLEALSNNESKTFIQVRLGVQSKINDENLDELVEELGGLPLALEQAAAHIKGLKCSFREYLEKFRQKRLKLLKAVKAAYDVSKERQTVRTTWQLNFDYIERQSEDEGLGNAAKTVMNVISFLFPDDIPLDLINVGSPEICFEDLRDTLHDDLGSKQIVEILTRFSLFQWRDDNSVSVHRLVQEVIRDSIMSSEELHKILLCAIRMVNCALKQQPTPSDAMKEDNIGRTSLKHWNRLSYHASFLKAHLFDSTMKKDLKTICFNLETAKILQATAIYHSLAQRQDQAMEAQDQMLNVLTAIDVSEEDFSDLTAIKIPLMIKERLIIQSAMTSLVRCELQNGEFENRSSITDLELLRKKGNDAFRSNQYMAAIQYYSEAIVESLEVVDPKLLANRSISYLRAGDYDNALRDADRCIELDPKLWKGYCWKSYAITQLIKVGRLPQSWVSAGLAAASVAGHLNEKCLLEYRMKIEYPIVRFILIEKEKKLGTEIASLKNSRYTTLLLRNGRYKISSERGEVPTKSVQIIGIDDNVEIISSTEISLIHPPSSAFSIKFVTEPQINVYFENIIFPNETGLIFVGTKVSATFYKCTFLNGKKGCEDFSYCRGGQGCINTNRNSCKIKTENYEKGMDISGGGIAGYPGVCVGSSTMAGGKAFFQNCIFDRCGGGGVLCEGKGSVTEMKNCVSKNMIQMGAEARYGGSIVADNCIFMGNQSHGVAIGPRGYGLFTNCTIQGNKKEGFWCGRVVGVQKYQYDSSGQPQIGGSSCSIRDSIICQNGMCGISLEGGSYEISGNKIFENWFWGIIAKARSSTNITNNDIFENKCGGIRLGPNYSASVVLDGNSIRDHSGPGIHVEKVPENVFPRSLPDDIRQSKFYQESGIPSDEITCYSIIPIMTNRNIFKDNNRGFQHPNKLITILQTCCCCHRMWNDLKSCAKCKKAKYCSKNCQTVHWQRHKHLCKMLRETFNVDVAMSETKTTSQFFQREMVLRSTYPMEGDGEGSPPDRSSNKRFTVKIQSGLEYSRYDPHKAMSLYDQTRTLEIWFRNPQIYHIVNECGILCANQLSTKKIYCWASFKNGGKVLCLHTENLPPVQTW